MEKSFLTIKHDLVNEIVIEKSRFICSIKRVRNEDEAKDFVLFVKSKFPDATHNCYAYIADEGGFYSRYSDDGEPQGTAGLPMLETLKQKSLKQVAVVVTRYFGGIKLGTGGLARAYSDCVKKAVDLSGTVENIFSSKLTFEINYSLYTKALKLIESENAIKLSDEFLNDGVKLTIAVPSEKAEAVKDKICDFSAGKSTVLIENYGYLEYKTL